MPAVQCKRCNVDLPDGGPGGYCGNCVSERKTIDGMGIVGMASPVLPPVDRQFFISYRMREPDAAHAERIDAIARGLGYFTYFLRDQYGSGSVTKELRQAIDHSQCLVAVVSNSYWESGYCDYELNCFLNTLDVRRVLFFRIDDAPLPDSLQNPRWAGELAGLEGDAYTAVVQRALRAHVNASLKAANDSYTTSTVLVETAPAAQPSNRYTENVVVEPKRAAAAEPWLSWAVRGVARGAAVALVMLAVMVGVPLGAYYAEFLSQPLSEACELLARRATGADISLPFDWTWPRTVFEDTLSASEAGAMERWRALSGHWKAGKDSLSVAGAARLKSTEQGLVRQADQIAQFRTAFSSGRVEVLLDVVGPREAYRGFRLTMTEPGRWQPAFVSKEKGFAEKEVRFAERDVPGRANLHDLAVRREGDFFALIRNRDNVLANFTHRPKVDSEATGVVLSAGGGEAPLLFRWAVVAGRKPLMKIFGWQPVTVPAMLADLPEF